MTRAPVLTRLLRAYRPLDRQVEAALIYRWQTFHEDADALEVVAGVMPMALKLAQHEVRGESPDWDELVGMILTALMASLAQFRVGQGVKYGSYALIAVRHAVQRYRICSGGPVHRAYNRRPIWPVRHVPLCKWMQ